MKIISISAKAFRGISSARSINLDGKSLVLFGENGTGKSSFVEAIECALTGNIKSLSSRGIRISVKKHSHHVQFCEKDRQALVTFNFEGNTFGPTCAPFSDCQIPDNLKPTLKLAQKGSFILRRSALLVFVEAKDTERYDSIKPFLKLERYEEFEAGLKKASAIAMSEFQRQDAVLNNLKSIVGQKFDLTPQQVLDEELLKALEAGSKEFWDQPVKDLDSAKNLKKALQDLSSTKEQAAAEARILLMDLLSLVPQTEVLEELLALLKERCVEEKDSTQKFSERVLQLGLDWIESETLEECPLCEQSIEREIVLNSIRRRLEENSRLLAIRSQCDALRDRVIATLKQFLGRIDAVFKAIQKTGTHAEENLVELRNAIAQFDSVLSQKNYWSQVNILQSKLDVLQSVKLIELQKTTEQAFGWSSAVKGASYFKLLEQCTSYIEHVPNIYALLPEYSRAENVSERLTELYKQSTEIRKSQCELIFKEITGQIKIIYDSFHPNEPLGNFTLEVKEKGVGSAVLLGGFGEVPDVDPRAYFSEAHQDTLGLAVFLSLYERARQGSHFKLLVLDDILTSVDAAHRERVANYLLDEVKRGMQLVITTHNRPWFEWLLNAQAARGVREQFVNKQILDWSLADGPMIDDPQGDYESLKAGLPAGRYENILPIAGRLLEEVLQSLRFGLSLSVPAKRDEKYTIGDIYPQFYKKLKEFPGLKHEISNLADQINATLSLRNWMVHFNEWTKELSSGELKAFIVLVMQLYEKVYCDKCKTFVSKSDTDAGAVKCRKGCIVYRAPVAVTK